MTNDETIMTKEFSNARMPNLQPGISSFFRHSDLEISHFAHRELRPSDLSDLHFAGRAGNPDLFRTRLANGVPVHRPFDDLAHLREPPRRAGDTPLALRAVREQLDAVETEFELFVCRVCHNEPFFARHSGRQGWTKAVQGKEYSGVCT